MLVNVRKPLERMLDKRAKPVSLERTRFLADHEDTRQVFYDGNIFALLLAVEDHDEELLGLGPVGDVDVVVQMNRRIALVGVEVL